MPVNMVEIRLDKPRFLRFDINAIADLEEATGKSLMELMDENNIGISAMRALLWAGLKHQDKLLTLQRAGELIQAFIVNGGSLATLMEKVAKAITSSGAFGTPKESKGESGSEENPQSGETA